MLQHADVLNNSMLVTLWQQIVPFLFQHHNVPVCKQLCTRTQPACTEPSDLTPSSLPSQSPLSSILPCFLPSSSFCPTSFLSHSLPPSFPRLCGLFPLFCPLLLVVPLLSNSRPLSLNRRKLYNDKDLTSVCVFASGWDNGTHTSSGSETEIRRYF